MKIRELTGDESDRQLMFTAIDIVLAGKDGDVFCAAHGTRTSTIALRIQGRVSTWLIEDACLPLRQAKAQSVRDCLRANGVTFGA